jgi:sodium/potassium-transporting ATPase subunit alpha
MDMEPTRTSPGVPADLYRMQPMQSQMDNFPKFDLSVPELNELTHICYLCSKAHFDRDNVPLKDRTVIGDATESGLFRFAAMSIPDSDNLHATYPKVFEIPFNSTNKWHLSIHKKEHANGAYTLYIKGAPERIIRLCTSMQLENGKVSDFIHLIPSDTRLD